MCSRFQWPLLVWLNPYITLSSYWYPAPLRNMVTGLACTMAFGRDAPGKTSAPHVRASRCLSYPRSSFSHRVAVPRNGFT